AEDGIRDWSVTGVQTCALPICVNTITLDDGMLFRQGRFAGRRTQHTIHRVRSALRRLVEVPDLQFTQQSERDESYARHDQNRTEHHHGSVLVHDVHVADELLNDHPERDQQSSDGTDRAKAAKKVQRPRHVLEQEPDGDQVEKHAEGAPDAVMRLAMLAIRVADRYLADARAVS